MTITVSTNAVTFLGNGATTVFSYGFAMPAAANATLLYTDALGNQTTVAPGGYAITGVGQPTAGGGPQGGTVTYAPGGVPIAAGTLLTLMRTVPDVQPNSFSNQGGLWPSVVEASDDNLAMQIQQLASGLARALLFNPADTGPFATFPPAAQRALGLAGFDGSGNPIVAQPSSALVSTVMQPVVAASSLSSAESLFGISTAVQPVLAASTLAGARNVFGVANIVTPQQYGARGDGVTDDTAAINAAIVASAPGVVFFPCATYLIAGTLAITTGAVSLVGENYQGTVLQFSNGALDCITVQGASYAAQIYGFKLENLRINHGTKTGGRTLLLANVSQAVVRDVYVSNCWTGFEIWNTNNVVIDNVVIQNIIGGYAVPAHMGLYAPPGCYGVYWHSPGDGSARSDQLTTTSVVVNGNFSGAIGFIWDGWANTWNMFMTTALGVNFGLWVKNSAASANYWPDYLIADNFVTDGVISIGLLIEAGRSMSFVNSTITNTSGDTPAQGSADTNAVYIGADVPNSHTAVISFSNCEIGNCKAQAMVILGRNVTVTGCDIYAGVTTPANTYAAVEIGAGAQDIAIEGNNFEVYGATLTWKYGVLVDPGTFRVLVEGNVFYGAVTRSIQWNNSDQQSSSVGNISDNPPMVSPSGQSVASGATLLAAWMLGGAINVSGPGAAWTMNTDTAANIVAALQNPKIFAAIPLLVINSSVYALAIGAGSGVTFTGNGSGGFALPAQSQRMLMIDIVSPVLGSEAVTVYG
jgi:hypothetical protein